MAFSLAAQLLLESQQALVAGDREANNPQVQLATRLLRRDVQAASHAGSVTVHGLDELDGELHGVLALSGLANTVVYARLDSTAALAAGGAGAGELVRLVLEADGSVHSRRLLLRGIDAWSWQSLAGNLIEITLVHREHAGPRPARARPRPEPERQRVSQLRLALRGGPRRDGW